MRIKNLFMSHIFCAFPRTACAALLSCVVIMTCTGCNTEVTEPYYPDGIASSSASEVTDASMVASQIDNTDEAEANNAYTVPTGGTAEERFEYELSLIPFDQLQFLRLRGWKIELTSMNLAAEYGYSSSICGITDYNKNIIYISSNSNTIRRATIHEVGHAIAYELGWVEETDEFVEIFEEEKEFFTDCCSIGDGHEISDKYEYFASVYQNMILDYSDTKSEVPKTVEYIEDCLSRISIFDEENLHPAHLEGHPLWIT